MVGEKSDKADESRIIYAAMPTERRLDTGHLASTFAVA
jgi:hypothetical protein